MKRKRLIIIILACIVLTGSFGACRLSHWVAGPDVESAPVRIVAGGEEGHTQPANWFCDGELTVMSLNVAHGGGGGVSQVVRGEETVRATVTGLGGFIRDLGPDVVALQEADGPSAWSGDYNHVLSLGKESGLSHVALGRHINGMDLRYGTALLGHRLINATSHTFDPAPPLFTKGYLTAVVPWKDLPEGSLVVVSVHLDFLRAGVRREQVREMVEKLSGAKLPTVVMGDFNCEWEDGESAVAELAQQLDLKAYRPRGAGLETYPSVGKRLDWILIPPGLEFRSYRVVRCPHSDHSAIIARLGVDQAQGDTARRSEIRF